MKSVIIVGILSLLQFVGYSQQLYHADIYNGGITGGGFSSGVGNGANGQIIVNIDPLSTIRKAYLLCNRYGAAQPVDVTFNSIVYNFNLSNQVGANYFIANSSTVDSCAIHAIDITNDINPLQNTYSISYPNQTNTVISDKYGAFYLIILFENPLFSKVGVSVILNESNSEIITNYTINGINNIDINKPVGLAIHSDIIWDTINDGSYINVNGSNLGLIGGSDNINSIFTGGGVKGHFYYQNDSLFGLDDDTPDSLMASSDGLADISFCTSSSPNPLTIDFITKSMLTQYNIYLAFFLSYSTPCDTFSTSITSTTDTICPWGSAQLQATGGVNYSWFSAFGGLSDTSIANPVASPNQTTTYICTITNDSGCVKTEQVKIWVDQCIGIDEHEQQLVADIYPNPTNGNISIEFEKQIKNPSITILNNLGQEVFHKNYLTSNSIKLNLDSPKGIYFLQIKTNEGVITKKVVKH